MVAPFTKTSSTSNEPTVAKPEPVIVVIPLNAPLVSVAVPSVIVLEVKFVTPVTTPASTFTAPSNTIAEPDAGVKLIAPVEVLIVTAASPAVISVSYTHLTLPTIYSV